MVLAALLVFGSGLLVGWAYFTGRAALAIGGVPKVSGPAVPGAKGKSPTIATKFESKLKTLTSKVFSRKTTAPAAAPASAAKSPAAPTAAAPADASKDTKDAKDNGASVAQSDAGAAPPMPTEYCLQIGAFTDIKLAKQLQTTLKDKGYPVIIFDGTDLAYKTWHAVRMSKFTDIDSATKAAADFTAKERLQAIVRPSGQL